MSYYDNNEYASEYTEYVTVTDYSDEYFDQGDPFIEWHEITSFVKLLSVSIIAIWFQTVVTEERFVPSLNVIATRLRMSDDVAGATIMAAGSSSPELFAVLVSLFVTHSSLGLGTIIGSEIFTNMVCSSAAIFAARNQSLKLNPLILIREIVFYALSLYLFVVCLSDQQLMYKDERTHVIITVVDGIILIGLYCLYVTVCAYFDRILEILLIDSSGVDDNLSEGIQYEAFVETQVSTGKGQQRRFKVNKEPSLPFVRALIHEPFSNFHISGLEIEEEIPEIKNTGSIVAELYADMGTMEYMEKEELDNGCTSAVVDRLFLMDHMVPTNDIQDLHDIERNDEDNSISCYLWQRSSFYNKMKININAWQLRWFTFYPNEVISASSRSSDKNSIIVYPAFETFLVDEGHLILKIQAKATGQQLTFMAPSIQILSCLISKCEEILQQPRIIDSSSISQPSRVLEAHTPLIAFPQNKSFFSIIIFIILYPLRALLHFTLPDVRISKPTRVATNAYISMVLSLFYIILGSYVMVISLEALAHQLDIPDAVMGATIGAAGTSWPSLVASRVAASQGMGNMAVSNVFGSNIFNILLGLGIPWILYTSIDEEGQYTDLESEGITFCLVSCTAALLIFILVVVKSDFELRMWHAHLFNAVYIAFVIGILVQSYLNDE